jgi:hypothetical protein
MNEELNHLSGFLVRRPNREIERQDILACPSVRFTSVIPDTHWENYSYACPMPFRHEELANVKAPYSYPLVIRRSADKMLLLSFNNRVVEYLIEHEFKKFFRPSLRHVPIGVDGLVKALVAKPSRYALSFAHARVPAFGVALRAASFYGDDLAEASLLRDHIALMQFFTCGLRHAAGGTELIRIGNDGMILFYQRDSRTVREIERVLGYLKDEGFLASDIFAEDSKP